MRHGHIIDDRRIEPLGYPVFTSSPTTPLSDAVFEGIGPWTEGKPRRHPLNERDRAAADDWTREHLPELAESMNEALLVSRYRHLRVDPKETKFPR